MTCAGMRVGRGAKFSVVLEAGMAVGAASATGRWALMVNSAHPPTVEASEATVTSNFTAGAPVGGRAVDGLGVGGMVGDERWETCSERSRRIEDGV